mmetsp:Transcript_62809/g.187281  ORF Transcript_62809/g.187281 Transcript_62809/m.187281 type:complete len:118 (-) Transcript_62809:955-1308(-)
MNVRTRNITQRHWLPFCGAAGQSGELKLCRERVGCSSGKGCGAGGGGGGFGFANPDAVGDPPRAPVGLPGEPARMDDIGDVEPLLATGVAGCLPPAADPPVLSWGLPPAAGGLFGTA